MKKKAFLLLFIALHTLAASAQHHGNGVFDLVVAQDGTGDYATLQDAIDAAPEHQARPYTILIKAGRYHEHVFIPQNKPFIYLIGENRDSVTVWDDRVSGGPNAAPVDVAATLVSHATDVYLENICFENAWGTRHLAGPQALALYTKADKNIVNHCKMLSFQDTYRTANDVNARNYVLDCYIEGAVDFLYGQGNVFFDRCTLCIMAKQGGWIVAPKHAEGTTWGYVLSGTTITAPGNPAETTVWLGRPWLHSPMAVFINTRCFVTLPPEGWYDHMASLPKVYADYNTMDGQGRPLDLSKRISRYYMVTAQNDTVWGTAKNHLTADEAKAYTAENVMRGSDSWNPMLICRALPAPKALARGRKLYWKAVEGARGYMIYHRGRLQGLTTQCSYTITSPAGEYVVRAVGYGNGRR